MKEKIDERIKNIPDKIYLQVGDNVGWDVDFKELESTGEVTWCSDKIENWDIEYIRASEFEHLVNQEAEKRIAERMPRRDELIDEAQKVSKIKLSEREKALIRVTYRVIRSRLSQKTEGGTK